MQIRVYSTYISRDYIAVKHLREMEILHFRDMQSVCKLESFSPPAVNLSVRELNPCLYQTRSTRAQNSKRMRLFRTEDRRIFVWSVCVCVGANYGIKRSRTIRQQTFSSWPPGKFARSIHTAHISSATISLLGSMRNYEAISFEGLPGRCMYYLLARPSV